QVVESGCTTALDIVPWETDGESVSQHIRYSRSKIKAVVLPPTIYYTQTPNKDTLFSRWVSIEEESQSLSSKAIKDLYGQFADKWVYAEVRAKEELIEKVCVFRYEKVKERKR
ncbi:hypothetical protein Tco_1356951, partial [Tanacetum coccineum]